MSPVVPNAGDLSAQHLKRPPRAFLRSDKLCWSRCWRQAPQMRTTCQKSRARLTWHHLPTRLISIFPLTLRTENVTETSSTCYKTNNSKWETEKKNPQVICHQLGATQLRFPACSWEAAVRDYSRFFFFFFALFFLKSIWVFALRRGAGRCPNMWISAVYLAPSPPAGALCCFEVKVSQSYKVFAIESDHKTACFKEESGIKRWIPPP